MAVAVSGCQNTYLLVLLLLALLLLMRLCCLHLHTKQPAGN
jgi:hypothetical protein